MFCDAAPIWLFLKGLSAVERPEEARLASSGMHLIEVFPALALPSIEPEFYQRLAAPKYNPDNRRFRLEDWVRVARAAQAGFDLLNISAASCWCAAAAAIRRPVKADQDKLDAMLCLLIALHWRLQPRERSIMLGDVVAGYMVAPVSPVVRERLVGAARRLGIFAG
jgi:predicted RNase H-like nuclease